MILDSCTHSSLIKIRWGWISREKATSANTVPFLRMIFFWTVLRRQEELWAHFFTCFRSGEKFSKKYRKTWFSDYDYLDNM